MTYMAKAVIPLETSFPTLRTSTFTPSNKDELLGKSLDLIEERREKAMIIHPSSLHIIQPFFQPIDNDLINSLSLSISLRVGRSGILVCNSQIITVSPKGIAIKLKAIIRDEGMRDSKSSNDVLPDKFLCIHIRDVGQGLSFNLFGEIVCADQ